MFLEILGDISHAPAVMHTAEGPEGMEGQNSRCETRALLGAHLSPPHFKAARCPSQNTCKACVTSVVKLDDFLALSQGNSSTFRPRTGVLYSQQPHTLPDMHKFPLAGERQGGE